MITDQLKQDTLFSIEKSEANRSGERRAGKKHKNQLDNLMPSSIHYPVATEDNANNSRNIEKHEIQETFNGNQPFETSIIASTNMNDHTLLTSFLTPE